MKKRNLLLLILAFLISLAILGGLLVYAFYLQEKSDTQNNNDKENIEIDITPSVSPTIADSSAPTIANNQNSGHTDVTTTPTPTTNISSKRVILDFAGDVNLDENYYPAKKYDSAGKGISGIISEDLVKEMKSADVMMLNNEFAYSKRGTKEKDKSFTFRANPDRVDILKEMGVDIVSLANNHSLDYGRDALNDTFQTLDHAGIQYVGAGKNMERAKAPIYVTVGGRKIAFLAASRVIFAGNWYATDSQSGMVGAYNPSMMAESIKEAKANSDYVVIFVHWGVEHQSSIVAHQRYLAKAFIDAGADAVIGSHPHVMQGFEYYKGKLIAYSLGNFIFSNQTERTGLLKLYLDTDGSVRMQILPSKYSDTYTYLLTDTADKKNYIEYMKSISYHVNIDEDGFITESK